jgi:hypothetical protein
MAPARGNLLSGPIFPPRRHHLKRGQVVVASGSDKTQIADGKPSAEVIETDNFGV